MLKSKNNDAMHAKSSYIYIYIYDIINHYRIMSSILPPE